MMGPKCEREGIGQNVVTQTDTTPFALPFIGGVVLAVPCRVPQNRYRIRVGPLSVLANASCGRYPQPRAG